VKLPKLLARNSLYDCSIGEERVGMVASHILVLRKSCIGKILTNTPFTRPDSLPLAS